LNLGDNYNSDFSGCSLLLLNNKYISKNVRYKDFSIFEDQVGFDFKGFLIKIEVTEMVLLSLIITFNDCLSSQYSQRENLRRDPISVKEESNSFLPQIPVLIF
jgi:hypothetical protein